MTDCTPTKPSRSGPPRVLVVEPDRTYLAVIAKRIGEAGFRVVGVDTVEAAMVEMYRMPTDIVVAEMSGRKYSGVPLVKSIREDAVLRDTPVLMITGKSDSVAAVDALKAGADAIVRKPFDFGVLNARIAREIERRGVIEGLRRDNRTLDERVTRRAITVGELKLQLESSESERRRLARLIDPTAG